MNDKPKTTRLTTPVGILSYPHLFEPMAGEEGGKKKYSCALVFPPEADLGPLEAAAVEAARAKFGDNFFFEKQMPKLGAKRLRWPIRVDEEGKYGEPGEMRYINARSETKPGIVDAALRVIDDARAEEMYPGAKVRATVSAFGYDQPTNKGVSFGLGNVQKVGEGTRIDSRRSAVDDFEAIPSEELELAAADLI